MRIPCLIQNLKARKSVTDYKDLMLALRMICWKPPSIYRDWPMVQKGYQSLRMMNDNDNFNSEGFGSEWHHFAPCETAGCDGDIEYRDIYYCSKLRSGRRTEILIRRYVCPECEESC